MRIEPRHHARARKRLIAHEVKRAHALGPLPEPVCCSPCPDYRRSVGCHRHCPVAPLRLSSDGERYPLEPLVAPLVFELKRTGVFYPCWSCEGHADQAGDLWKIPRVWFYADSVVHIRALAESIDGLVHARRLSVRWHIAVTYSDATNPDTTFSLEPESAPDSSLKALQNDLRILSEELAPLFWRGCDALAAQVR